MPERSPALVCTSTSFAVGSTMTACPRKPRVLVTASAVGWYGSRGDQTLDEKSGPGHDFLAEVCVAWERESSAAAEELGLRVVQIRTGVVLDKDGGALAKMLPPFKLGVGGPVAGGDQYLPWIHADDLVALYLRALDDPSWSGPYNGAAPEPVRKMRKSSTVLSGNAARIASSSSFTFSGCLV